MTFTAHDLLQWTGLAALAAGVIFAGIQPIHPADVLGSVTTGTWVIIISFKLLMCFLFLIGIAGIYVRQVEESGWLGLVGVLLLIVSWSLQSGFVFTELLVLPPLATAAPQFIDSFLGLANGMPGEMDIGALAPAYAVVGLTYMLGGLVFGVATFRAKVLPQWPAVLMAITAILTPLAAMLPHDIQRYVAVPMGIAFAWLGYALWSERRSVV
jgi:hypothetical protein